MLDRVIRWSLQNRLVTLFGAAAVLAGGLYSSVAIPIDVFPDLTAPTVTVLTEAHGMAAEEVELLVTFPLESALNGAPGVRRLRSYSAAGIVVIRVDFEWDTNIYRARQVVTERLQTVPLPAGASRPELGPIGSVMGQIAFVALTSENVARAVVAPRRRSGRMRTARGPRGGNRVVMQVVPSERKSDDEHRRPTRSASAKQSGLDRPDVVPGLESEEVHAVGDTGPRLIPPVP